MPLDLVRPAIICKYLNNGSINQGRESDPQGFQGLPHLLRKSATRVPPGCLVIKIVGSLPEAARTTSHRPARLSDTHDNPPGPVREFRDAPMTRPDLMCPMSDAATRGVRVMAARNRPIVAHRPARLSESSDDPRVPVRGFREAPMPGAATRGVSDDVPMHPAALRSIRDIRTAIPPLIDNHQYLLLCV